MPTLDRVLLEVVANAGRELYLSELDALLAKRVGRTVSLHDTDIGMRGAIRKGWLYSDGIRLRVLDGGRRELRDA